MLTDKAVCRNVGKHTFKFHKAYNAEDTNNGKPNVGLWQRCTLQLPRWKKRKLDVNIHGASASRLISFLWYPLLLTIHWHGGYTDGALWCFLAPSPHCPMRTTAGLCRRLGMNIGTGNVRTQIWAHWETRVSINAIRRCYSFLYMARLSYFRNRIRLYTYVTELTCPVTPFSRVESS